MHESRTPASCPPAVSVPPSVAHPYYRSSGESYERLLFTATNPDYLALDVRSLYINPHGQGQFPNLGAGLLEVMAGTGTLYIGSRSISLQSAGVIAFDAHESVTLTNLGEQPLVVRLYLFGVH